VERPNILYIHSHDTGRYVQPYGHAILTPNIQRLAEGGVLLRQAFCAAPTCSPSRAALLTGQCAHSSGMLGLAHRGFALADYGQHIVHTLRTAGYRSALAGVQHVADDPKRIGYDDILANKGWLARDIAAAAAEFLESEPHQPFFLSVGFFETHRQFREAGPEEPAQFCQPPLPLPDAPETRQDMARFKASARALDEAVGIVLEALERTGLADRTLVICTTDHGLAFPMMKCNLTDHGIGVMLILRGPGGFAGGRVCNGMVSHIDLFPTLCDLLDIDQPDWLQGRSILPMMHGEVEEVNDEVFAEVSYHAAYEPQRAVRTGRWKYIRRFEQRDSPVLPNADDGPSKTLLLTHGWREHAPAQEQLYDLVFDPVESNNLAADPSYAEVLTEMRGRLDRWMGATDDPLLSGTVAAPPGARVNDPDGLSPSEATRPATQ
jgi:N-sulfoglucosamine sulfohydrolase